MSEIIRKAFWSADLFTALSKVRHREGPCPRISESSRGHQSKVFGKVLDTLSFVFCITIMMILKDVKLKQRAGNVAVKCLKVGNEWRSR